MVGSVAYMSPECMARRPGRASDQYSLAITYVELRTGTLPFASMEFLNVLDSHRHGKLDLRRLSTAEQDVIRVATKLEPAKRFSSCGEFVEELGSTLKADHRKTTSKRSSFPGQIFGLARRILWG